MEPRNSTGVVFYGRTMQYFFFRTSREVSAKFDFDKTRWFNQQYLRVKSKEDLAKDLQEILKQNGVDALMKIM